MAGTNSYIQVAEDGAGKKLQTKVSTIGADDVHSEAVFLVDDSGIYLPTLPVSVSTNLNTNGTVVATSPNASNFLATVSGTITATQSNASNLAVSATQGAANWTVDQQKIVGTTVDVNSGTASAGTQRVIVATDQPNVNINLSRVAGTATSTAASGVQKVGIVGNSGQTVDGTNDFSGSAPTAGIAVMGKIHSYDAGVSTSSAFANTGRCPPLMDSGGNLRTTQGLTVATTTTWSSGTALNTTVNLFNNSGAPTILCNTQTSAGTFSAGAITFEASFDGSNFATIPADTVMDAGSTTLAQIVLPYTLITSTTKSFLITNRGWQVLRIKLSTAITGTGTVAIIPIHLSHAPYTRGGQDFVAGTAIDVNSGNKSAGTQRVVLATDQPALTNKLLVTPDANSSFNLSQIGDSTVIDSVDGVIDVMPRKRTGATGLSPNYISGRISTSTTTTLVAATCYLSSLHMTCANNAGTTWAMTVRNGEATPKILIPNFVLNANFLISGTNTGLSANPIFLQYSEPIPMTSGINVVTVGGTPGNVDYFLTYWQ